MSEKQIYSGKYLQVKEKIIGESVYELAYLRGASIIFPLTDSGKFLFIKEVRPHETPSVRWKPVTGFIDDGEDWKTTADRELQEEAGFKAEELELIYHLPHQGNINVDKFWVLARGLSESSIPNPDGDVVKEMKEFSIDEIIDMTMTEEIPIFFDSLGFFLLREKIQRGEISLS